MNNNCPRDQILSAKFRVVSLNGDEYYGDDENEARRIFDTLSGKGKSVDGKNRRIVPIVFLGEGKVIEYISGITEKKRRNNK
jgi:hypothetical protein